SCAKGALCTIPGIDRIISALAGKGFEGIDLYGDKGGDDKDDEGDQVAAGCEYGGPVVNVTAGVEYFEGGEEDEEAKSGVHEPKWGEGFLEGEGFPTYPEDRFGARREAARCCVVKTRVNTPRV